MVIDSKELKGYIFGLKLARSLARQYKDIDQTNYIDEMDKMIDKAEQSNAEIQNKIHVQM